MKMRKMDLINITPIGYLNSVQDKRKPLSFPLLLLIDKHKFIKIYKWLINIAEKPIRFKVVIGKFYTTKILENDKKHILDSL